MSKKKPARLSILPRGMDPSKFRLNELRSFKELHALLSQPVSGPPVVSEHFQAFRFLLFFGIACVHENTYPPLTRCWKDMEKLFMSDPAFEDGIFVQSWILMDFPFGPERQTALDYFEQFLEGTEAAPQFRQFISTARESRLGLYQDVMRTKTTARFRELFTGNVVSTIRSVEEYGQGEILLTRILGNGDQRFMFGDPKGFPKEMQGHIENMVENKLFFLDGQSTSDTRYETFMKLAGPYWMSCVTKNEETPILDPDHYLSYLS